jgi:NAD(P)H-dependent flavin oxidoreductase YrpB (nitropropane dioxygenase family)
VGETARLDGSRVPILRFGAAVVDQTVTGAIAAMALWAGESVGGVTRVQPAAEVMRELAQGADALLQR